MNDKESMTLEELFDKPRKKLVDRHHPKHCSICGCRSENLTPHPIGKSTLYICWFCQQVIEEPKKIEDTDAI